MFVIIIIIIIKYLSIYNRETRIGNYFNDKLSNFKIKFLKLEKFMLRPDFTVD